MAFDPLDWWPLAEELLARPDEAARRTAITRLYYAVWLKTLLGLERKGLYASRGDRSDHSAVVRTLKLNRRTRAALEMESLARLRELADYDVSVTIDAGQADRARQMASEVRRLLAPDWE